VDKASAYMKTETQKPEDSQNYENCPKHDYLLCPSWSTPNVHLVPFSSELFLCRKRMSGQNDELSAAILDIQARLNAKNSGGSR
jgi:hypothetical protein